MLSFSRSKNLTDTFNLNTELNSELNWYNNFEVFKGLDDFEIIQNFYSKIEIPSFLQSNFELERPIKSKIVGTISV